VAKKQMAQPEDNDGLGEELDLLQLEVYWVKQGRLAGKYYKKLAKARKRLDDAKSKLELVEAQVARDIRSDPEEYGIDSKVTEKAIEAAVIMSKAYREVVAEVNQATYEVGLVNANCTEIEHRKRSLEKLVDLHGQDYFAEPRASENSHEAVEEFTKRKARTKRRKESDDE
jgi:hypothetical protein